MKKHKLGDVAWSAGRLPCWQQTKNGFQSAVYGSVEIAVVVGDDGLAIYDRPVFTESDNVIIVPWMRENNQIKVCLIKEEKPLATEREGSTAPIFWCFPGGFVDTGEDVRTAATREAQEEAGVSTVLNLEHIGTVNPNPTCFASSTPVVALETDGVQLHAPLSLGGERIVSAEFFSVTTVLEYVRCGHHDGAEFSSGTSLAALVLFIARYPEALN